MILFFFPHFCLFCFLLLKLYCFIQRTTILNCQFICFSQELEYCKSVVLSVEDEMGVRFVMEDLLSNITHNNDTHLCTSAVLILHAFCANTTADISDYLPQLFRGLIGLFSRTDDSLLLASWQCLNAIAKVREGLRSREKQTAGFKIWII